MSREIVAGDWVRVVTATGCDKAVNFTRRVYDEYPKNKLMVGDVFRVDATSPLYVSYKLRGGIRGTDSTYKTNVVRCNRPPILGRWANAVATTIAGAMLAVPSATSIAIGDNRKVNYLNDPTVHQTIVATGTALAAIVGINLSWLTLTHIARGFGKMGDRRRTIKQEKQEGEVREYERDKKERDNDVKLRQEHEVRQRVASEASARQQVELAMKADEAKLNQMAAMMKDMVQVAIHESQRSIAAPLTAELVARTPHNTYPHDTYGYSPMKYDTVFTPRKFDLVRITKVEPENDVTIYGRKAKVGDIAIVAIAHGNTVVELTNGNKAWTRNIEFLNRPIDAMA